MRSVAVPLRVGLICAGLGAVALGGKSKFNAVVSVGDPAPAWRDLPGADGKRHSLRDLNDARVAVVMFTCNHCPMAAAYEERVLQFVKEFGDRGVRLTAISVSRHAADRLEKMQERERRKPLAYSYLCDETQEIGRAYGATCTPHFFVLDERRRIAYMGAFDDSADPEKVEKRYLVDAVEALLAGRVPETKESLQRGCPIEYE